MGGAFHFQFLEVCLKHNFASGGCMFLTGFLLFGLEDVAMYFLKSLLMWRNILFMLVKNRHILARPRTYVTGSILCTTYCCVKQGT